MKKVVFLLILIQSLCLLPLALAEDSWVLWEKEECTGTGKRSHSDWC